MLVAAAAVVVVVVVAAAASGATIFGRYYVDSPKVRKLFFFNATPVIQRISYFGSVKSTASQCNRDWLISNFLLLTPERIHTLVRL